MNRVAKKYVPALLLAVFSPVASVALYTEDPPSDGRTDRPARKRIEYQDYSREAEQVIDRMVEAIQKTRSYRDEGVVRYKTGMGFGDQNMKSAFTMERPRRFRIDSMMHEFVGDGCELTVMMKNNRRYVVKPLQEDLLGQIRSYGVGAWANFSVAELWLEKDTRSYMAERFVGLRATGEEDIEGERCIRLEGRMLGGGMVGGGTQGTQGTQGSEAKLWIDRRSHMLRRLEVKMSGFTPEREQDDENEEEGSAAFAAQMRNMTLVFDVNGIRLGEDIDDKLFVFESPSGAKKVEQFYGSWMTGAGTAQAFEMSGRSIPEFSLKDTDGRLHGNRSLADKVLVLYFQMPTFGWRGDDTSGLDKLEELRAEFESRGVTVLCVHSGDRPEALAEKIRARGHRLTVLHDDGGMLRREFFERQWDGGIVLVGRDGVVQGRYAAFISDTQLKSLRSDVEKLLAGEALPGGRALTEEEIEEMTDQQSAMFLPNAADPLHEDYIKERWSVRAQDSGSNWGMGTGQSTGPGEGMWVRDKDTLMQIDADGRVVREMPLAEPSREQMAQEQYVIGRVGSRMGVVYMSTVPGESQNQWGFKPPKAARFVASDESGRKLWELEVDAEMASVPAHLALADLDGRPGDELVFYHRGVVWVVDSKGEVLVRRSIPTGWVLWMRVQDADRDGKAEIYVRTQSRLHRYDYAR